MQSGKDAKGLTNRAAVEPGCKFFIFNRFAVVETHSRSSGFYPELFVFNPFGISRRAWRFHHFSQAKGLECALRLYIYVPPFPIYPIRGDT